MAVAQNTSYFVFLSDISIQAIAVFFAVFLALVVWMKRHKNLPPSPSWSWPVVGHLFSLGRAPHLKLTEWRKQYGDVYTVRMGMKDVVVINGHRAIKEALVDYKDAFSSRPNIYTLDMAFNSGKDLAFSKFNKAYKEKRKFFFSALRNLGMKMGPGSKEEDIRDEARQLCTELSKGADSSPRDISDYLTVAVANVICTMVFAKRHDYDDADFLEVANATNKIIANIGACQLMAVVPFLRFIPGINAPHKDLAESVETLTTYIRHEITKHRETLDSENPRDFIDLLLTEVESHESTDCLAEENIVCIIEDTLVPGIETTTTTLRWGLLYMVLCPEEQQKVQAELDSVLGRDYDVPTLAHRSQLPYTEATIMEIERIRAIIALNLPHAATFDTNFRGYNIPAGMQVIINIWSAQMDPEYWPDPEKFDPRRFLDPEGRIVGRPDSFMPFSAGRRVCIAEQLAKMEIFLLFSALLKRFTFKLPEGAAKPSTDGHMGISLVPPPVKMCVTQR